MTLSNHSLVIAIGKDATFVFMSNILQFTRASTLSLESFTTLFNHSFENYFYPMNLTPKMFAARLRLESIDLHHSVVIMVADTPVGQATLGLRGDTAWCGGFGIIPEFRGKQLAQPLMNELVRAARELGAKQLILEVLHKNSAAQKVYANAGLKHQRELLLFQWLNDSNVAVQSPQTSVDIQPANVARIVENFYRLHPVPAAWQRDLPTLMSQTNILQISHYEHDVLQGYILFTVREDTARILDVGAIEVSIVKQLLTELQHTYKEIISVNEPEASPLTKAFLDCGFREFDRQYQLGMSL